MTNTQNNNMPYIIIIILLVVIAILAFFLGKGYNNGAPVGEKAEKLTITIIDDRRCTTCNSQELISQIQSLPFLASAQFEIKDFSDAGVPEQLISAGISAVPAIIFEHNRISDYSFLQYLQPTQDGKYSLETGAKYDPFTERSERGFLVLEENIFQTIQANSHVYGNEEAEIAWIEYSDVECAFCRRLHNEGTHEKLFEIFGESLSLYYQYYAIFNKEIPEVLECMIEQKGSEIQYPTLKKVFENEISSKQGLLDIVEGIDETELNACISSGKYKSRIEKHMETGSNQFKVTGTPGNILLNTQTGEYEILPGAYPVSDFERVINSLKIQ